MRIVAGAWRGKSLIAPPGQGTRPTADRVRQPLFDMLMHAAYAGRDALEGAAVLDGFAGTGALGLEALSRGAATACFIENDPAALKALRANVTACKAESRTEILSGDLFTVRAATSPSAATLVFLDPPYGQNLVPKALGHLQSNNRIAPGALIVAETGRDETWLPNQDLLAERRYGAARILIFRAPA